MILLTPIAHFILFILPSPAYHPHLHSFPTRRSSDLMKNINHTRSSISDDIRNILCSSANMRRAIPLILQRIFLMSSRSEERFSRNAETDLVCRLLLEKKKKKKDRRRTDRQRKTPHEWKENT